MFRLITVLVFFSVSLPGYAQKDSLVALGSHYELNFDYDRAYDLYTQALGSDSTDTRLMMLRARMAEQTGRLSVCRSMLGQMLLRDSTDYAANYMMGRLDFSEEVYRKALARFGRMLAADSTNRVLLERVGDCHWKIMNIDSAAACYNRLLSLDSRNLNAAKKLIGALSYDATDMPRCTDAYNVCIATLAHYPDNIILLRDKANLLFNIDELYSADRAFQNLLDKGDTTVASLETHGRILNKLGKHDRAIELMEMALGRSGGQGSFPLLVTLATSYAAVQKIDLATEAASEAAGMQDLYNMMMQRCWGEVYRCAGKRKEAGESYYNAWKLVPGRLDMISEILALYPPGDSLSRDVALWGLVIYVDGALNMGIDPRRLRTYRQHLQRYNEDLFFSGAEYLVMSTPAGEKSRMTRARLEAIIARLDEE